mmetsp:Transcript_46371/g.51859  ORF Transcript_46371/g.51859 Transcript_46371/m.51859 type:complete len:666 (-) Transcript_46371:83-2080(-)
MKIASTRAISFFLFAALCRICAATDVPDDWTVPELTGVTLALGHDEKVSEVADVSDFRRWLYTAGDGSCDAVNSCTGVAADAVIGDRSCTAGERLDNPNNNWDQELCLNAGGNGGHFEIGNDSCKNGHRACRNAGIDGYFKAGSNSCRACDTGTPDTGTPGCGGCYSILGIGITWTAGCTSGNYACHAAGEYYAVVGDNSCRGHAACNSIGVGSNITVGEGSCLGESSCSMFGQDSSQTGRIGDNSCNALNACMVAGNLQPHVESVGPVIIGKGSCNCERCCNCFVNKGVIIPDGKCNSIGECCTPMKKIVDGFDVTNPNGDTVTDPSPPSPPGTVHAAAPVFDIVYDGCTFINDETGVSGIGAITCNFAASGTDGHTVTSAIYATNCEDAKPNGVDQDADPTFTRVIEATDTNKQETSTYNVTVSLANSALPSPVTDTDTSSINFCLKAQVEDKNNDVYDWTGQLIKLDVGVDGKFSTSEVSTGSFNGLSDLQDIGDVNYGVTAFRCDENGERDESATDLELGDNFYLCAVGVQSAVIINSITTLTADKGEGDLALTTANLITAGDPNSNTFVYASPKKKKVGIATRLPSTFYREQGAVTFAGTADIDVSGGRRQLVRIMQEASTGPESANFSMEIGVVASGAYRASVFGAAAAVFVAVTAFLL